MKKEKVISIIKNAIESHEVWIKHGQILIDGLNLENAQAPLSCEDCEFHLWFNSNGKKLRNFSWYTEINNIHTKFHKSYSVLYYESMRMYNPKTRAELIERFNDLELRYNSYQKLLNEVHEELDDMIVADYEDKLADEEIQIEKPEVAVADCVNTNKNKNEAEEKTPEINDSVVLGTQKISTEKQEVEELKADLEKPIDLNDNTKKVENDSIEVITKDAVIEMQSEHATPPVDLNKTKLLQRKASHQLIVLILTTKDRF